MNIKDVVERIENFNIEEEEIQEEMSDSAAVKIVSKLKVYPKIKSIKGIDEPEAGKFLKGETIEGLKAALTRYNSLIDEFTKRKKTLPSVPDSERGKEVAALRSLSKEIVSLRKKISRGASQLASATETVKVSKARKGAEIEKAKKREERATLKQQYKDAMKKMKEGSSFKDKVKSYLGRA